MLGALVDCNIDIAICLLNSQYVLNLISGELIVSAHEFGVRFFFKT